MGRPSKGDRVQVLLRVPRPLLNKIDSACGAMSRTEWMLMAAERALNPIAVFRDPMLDQTPHQHSPGKIVSTRFVSGKKVRTYQCADADCEMEMTVG